VKAIILTLILSLTASAQMVPVPQRFIDKADQAFTEVIILRESVELLQTEVTIRKHKDALQSELIASLKTEIEALRDQNKKLSALKCDTVTFFFVIKKKRCR
jgi:hypothetical protein